MQENEFEKRIRQNMEQFALRPNEDVWTSVAARLQKKKKRDRLFGFLLFTSIILIAGFGRWFYLSKTSNISKPLTQITISQTENERQKPVSRNNLNTEKIDVKDRIAAAKELSGKEINKTRVNENTASQHKQIEDNITVIKESSKKEFFEKERIEAKLAGNTIKTIKSESKITSQDKGDKNDKILLSKAFEEVKFPKFSKEAKRSMPIVNNVFTTIKDGLETLVNRSVTKNHDTATTTRKDTIRPALAAAEINKPLKLTKHSIWVFGLTIYTGVSDNISSPAIFNSGGNYERQSLSNSALGTSGSPSSVPAFTMLSYSKSLSYAIGFTLQKQVSQKVFVTTGLNYHFYSANSTVGNRSTLSTTLYDSVLLKTTSISDFYGGGTVNIYKNKYHLLELPVHLIFQLNKKREKPFTVSAGFAAGYLIGSNALYANNRRSIFYVEKDQFKRLQLLGQAGFQIAITGSRSYTISIGPEIQYGFTNLTKSVVNSDQHLFSVGLKAHLLLK